MHSSRLNFNKITILIMVIFLFSTVVAHAAPVYDYYPNGRIKSITYAPPENGVSYIEYLDEEWGWLGHGRTYRKIAETADVYNAISYEYSYQYRAPIVGGAVDAGAQNDLVVDLGASGLYSYVNNSTWTQVAATSPEDMVVGDVDNDGLDDIVADFGATGIYKRINNSTWIQIATNSSEYFAVADLDGNGMDEIIADFGASGLYSYTNNSTWIYFCRGSCCFFKILS